MIEKKEKKGQVLFFKPAGRHFCEHIKSPGYIVSSTLHSVKKCSLIEHMWQQWADVWPQS